ncbi:SRPBCC family protein [Brevundimonas sp.]|uniref:SRPBCC family protein n=1 Tax=Brevundimonas sp. TaxID=1871086 RepID=UPI002FC8FB0E
MTAAARPCVAHGTFVVERRYDASPARVFRAHSDPDAFRRWFAESENWTIHEWVQDFRVGGGFTGRFRFGDESNDTWFNDTAYLDIVPDRRIVLSYVMGRVKGDGKQRASASLATTELVADGSGARLIYTEQGAFLEGADDIRMREEGCAEMLEALGRELESRA